MRKIDYYISTSKTETKTSVNTSIYVDKTNKKILPLELTFSLSEKERAELLAEDLHVHSFPFSLNFQL